MPEIEVDHNEEIEPAPPNAPKRDIFGGGDPIGTLIEHGEGDKHHLHADSLTAYQRGESGIPRFVGPAPKRPGMFRRMWRWVRGG